MQRRDLKVSLPVASKGRIPCRVSACLLLAICCVAPFAGCELPVAPPSDSGNTDNNGPKSLTISGIAIKDLRIGDDVNAIYTVAMAELDAPDILLSWSIDPGIERIPPGVNFSSNENTATFYGVPTVEGWYIFELRVQSSSATDPRQNRKGALAFKIHVLQPLALTAVVPLNPDLKSARTFNNVYCAAYGGTAPYTWSLVGTTPAWIHIDASTGRIYGEVPATIIAQTTYDVVVQVTDASQPAKAKERRVTWDVIPANPNLAVTTMSLPDATVGEEYGERIQATGFTTEYRISHVGGDPLPDGLSIYNGLLLNGPYCAVVGTPLAGSEGPYSVMIAVTDVPTNQQVHVAYTFEVLPGVLPLAFVRPAGLDDALEDQAYHAQCVAEGGDPANNQDNPGGYSWTMTDAPTWLSIDPATGLLSGTPLRGSASNQSVFLTIAVTDGTTTDELTFSIKTRPYQRLGISEAIGPVVNVGTGGVADYAFAPAYIGELYGMRFVGFGGNGDYQWQIADGELPEGLELDQGFIFGRVSPTATLKDYSFKIGISDSGSNPADVHAIVSGWNTIRVEQVPVAGTLIPLIGTAGGITQDNIVGGYDDSFSTDVPAATSSLNGTPHGLAYHDGTLYFCTSRNVVGAINNNLLREINLNTGITSITAGIPLHLLAFERPAPGVATEIKLDGGLLRDVACDPSGNLFTVMDSGELLKLDTALPRNAKLVGSQSFSGIPSGLSVDAGGDYLYLTRHRVGAVPGTARILKLDLRSTGRTLAVVAENTSLAYCWKAIAHAGDVWAAVADNGTIFNAERGSIHVLAGGITQSPTKILGQALDGITYVTSLVFDAEGNLYFAERTGNIYRVDYDPLAGDFVRNNGRPVLTKLNEKAIGGDVSLAFDDNGRLYVTGSHGVFRLVLP